VSLLARTIGVVGAGTMGSGIAQLCLQSGCEVRLYDVSEDVLQRGEARIQRGLARAEQPEVFSMMRKTASLRGLEDCDAVIEAAVEDLAVKQDLFRQLDAIVPPPVLLATNTSSLSVGRIASATENPQRVAGIHFFNPAAVMRLVEVVRAEHTSEETAGRAVELAVALGKTVVRCKDTPGFIANRVARPFYREGLRLMEKGAGSPAVLDRALRHAGGFKMGPFELMDLIGLEVNLAISRSVYEALGRPERLKPSPIQEGLVARGDFGRKSGRGFYLHGEGDAGGLNPALDELAPGMNRAPLKPEDVLAGVLSAVVAEARLAKGEGVASEADIDTAMELGLNWPKGPFAWAKAAGL